MLDGRSLLEATVARARRFARPDQIWVVCGAEHARAIKRQAGLPAGRVLVEPMRRNTAMAAAWATLRIQAEDPDAVIAMLSADHHIPDANAFATAMRRGAVAARDASTIVTLGVRPTRPETGYGYLRVGAPAGRKYPGLREVETFVEKPTAARAKRYVASGGYRWNAGIFMWSADTLLEDIESCAPDLHDALEPLRAAPRTRRRATIEAAYRRAPSLPIDVAVMERSKRVWMLPVEFRWSDVGTWASLAQEIGVGRPSPRGKRDVGVGGNRVVSGDVLFEGASRNLVWGDERLVALLGVDDLAVIDTGDVILITQLKHDIDVRRVVKRLQELGRTDLT